MDRRTMEESAKKFCKTLEYLIGKEDWSAADTEWAKNAISGVEKLMKLGYEDEYSQRGYSQRTYYSRDGDAGGGNSYGHYTRGYYSRDGGYSGHGMREHLEQMMQEAKDDRERETIRRFMSELDR